MSGVEIARWIREYRERAGLSVHEFARAMDVTSSAVYAWQNENDPARPGESRVPLVAETLGVTETEVRRALGYWVDDAPEPTGEFDLGEFDLDQMVDMITTVIRQMDKIPDELKIEAYRRMPSDAQRGLNETALGVLRIAALPPDKDDRRTG